MVFVHVSAEKTAEKPRKQIRWKINRGAYNMLKNELLVLHEKRVNERTNIIQDVQRILQISKGFLDGFSAVHIVCSYDARAVAEVALPRNLVFHKVNVWRDRKGAIRFFFHLFYLICSIRYAVGLLRKNRSISVVMNLMNHQTHGFLSVFLSRLCGRKSVVRVSNDVESAIFVCRRKYGKLLGMIYDVLIHPIERLTLDKADIVVTVSPMILEKYPHYKNKVLIRPVLIPALDQHCHSEFPEKPQGKQFHLLFVGRLEPGKGVETLLDALADLRDVKCFIVGDGSLKSTLEERTRKLGIQHLVEFHGFLPQERVFELMEKTDSLVLPSYNEYMSNVVVEAAAIGLPIIASDVRGIEYLVKDGETAILFGKGNVGELRRKILFLKENSVVRERIRRNAKEFVCENYCTSATETRAQELLYALISSS